MTEKGASLNKLTTDEERKAEALRQETLQDDERIEQGPEEGSDQQST